MAVRSTHRIISHNVGPHVIDLEFPDLVHIHYVGNVELTHFLGFNDAMKALPPETPLYLLRDARLGGLVTADTRQHIANRVDNSRFAAIATYGSSFQTKTVFSNMNRALRRMQPYETPVKFFTSEQDARQWFAELRQIHASKPLA